MQKISSEHDLGSLKTILRYSVASILLIYEAYIAIIEWGKDFHTFEGAILVNMRIMSLAAIAGLAITNLVYHEDMGLQHRTTAFQLRSFKAATQMVIGLFIISDLINLFVGAFE